jgi:hypothetical protein
VKRICRPGKNDGIMGSMEKGSGAQYARVSSTESIAMRVWCGREWGREMGSRVNHRLTEELLSAISTREGEVLQW